MDAGRLRRVTGSLCLSFHGLTRVLAVAVLTPLACFDTLVERQKYFDAAPVQHYKVLHHVHII